MEPETIGKKIQEQAGAVSKGARTWQFWLNGTISALIGGGFSSLAAALGVAMAQISGLDVGDMISVEGLAYVFGCGGGLRASKFLSDFKLPVK